MKVLLVFDQYGINVKRVAFDDTGGFLLEYIIQHELLNVTKVDTAEHR